MGAHPPYYADLVRRRFEGEPPLTSAEAAELELHLLICPRCAYATAERLRSSEPTEAERLLREAAAMLLADGVVPYLRECAVAACQGRDPTGFERLVRERIEGDPVALGRYRLIRADVRRRRAQASTIDNAK